jgi:hypothetical protein
MDEMVLRTTSSVIGAALMVEVARGYQWLKFG